MKRFVDVFLLLIFVLSSCDNEDIPIENNTEENQNGELLFNLDKLPVLKLTFSLDEWNQLLAHYDEDPGNKEFVKCKLNADWDNSSYEVLDIGGRIRGAWSRNRPEGEFGMPHSALNTDWNHCSFALNFSKYYKDEQHEIKGVKKIDLKYFNIDPAYVREIYIYDLLRRFGIDTAIKTSYCRLYISVEGDDNPAYYGIYMMMEHIDKNYLKDRIDIFGDSKGSLWKCEDATLSETDNELFFIDDNSSDKHNYELKTNEEYFIDAKSELKEFIFNYQTLQGDEFHDWIMSVCNVDLLLRTYAVIVACGDWDDYWDNRKNFYLYFNSEHKFFFIPFDVDNSLGICVNKYVARDTGKTNPFQWGVEECNLISKLLNYPDFRKIYSNALEELIDPNKHLFNYIDSSQRISNWWKLISAYIDNDIKEHNYLVDSPTFGSSHTEYRLIEDSPNNFFKVRSETIRYYLDQE